MGVLFDSNKWATATRGKCAGLRSDSMDSLQARQPIKVAIEAEDRPNPVPFHDSDVDRIPGRQQLTALNNLTRTQHFCSLDRKYFVDDAEGYLKRGTYGVPLSNRRVPMKNLLQHFSVRDQSLAAC